LIEVAGNQVLAAIMFAHLVQRRIRLSARLRLRKRINHLQRGDVVTKHLFRLVPHRVMFCALLGRGSSISGGCPGLRRGTAIEPYQIGRAVVPSGPGGARRVVAIACRPGSRGDHTKKW
jgi:hypothetical protein